MKKCPNCCEYVFDNAKRCNYCSYLFTEADTDKYMESIAHTEKKEEDSEGEYESYYTPSNNYYDNEGYALGIVALVFSILGFWIGLILSIIGICSYKGEKGKGFCKASFIILLIKFVLAIVITAFVVFTNTH